MWESNDALLVMIRNVVQKFRKVAFAYLNQNIDFLIRNVIPYLIRRTLMSFQRIPCIIERDQSE